MNEGVLICIAIIIILYFTSRIFDSRENILKRKEQTLKLESDRLKVRKEFELEFEQKLISLKEDIKKDTEIIINEKTQGFPWLAEAISEYYQNLDLVYARYLSIKSRPAVVQSEKIKAIALEKKIFKKEFITAKYIIKYYESLFPWLPEYVGFDSEELIKEIYKEKHLDEDLDPVKFYLSSSEYTNLSVKERNQKALDRYWKRDKKPWQLGRDYERYIGNLYEAKGYKVSYYGADKGFDDLGRDLICKGPKGIEIVQCKYWSKDKNIPIRENHINQLFGTTIHYYLSEVKGKRTTQLNLHHELLQENKITPTLITSTFLSETAKEFAKMLNVKVLENIPFNPNYPSIKCNISQTNGEKIYHLPFDQQYDKVIIELNKGEKYVKTVAEAEDSGFRRAWRWQGNKTP